MTHRGPPQPLCDCLELAHRAAEELKAVGFEHVRTSMRSEATYYRLPGRHGLLRIGCHPHRPKVGMDYVTSALTFRGGRRDRDHIHCGEERFQNMLWMAVGQYVMRSAEEKPSNYSGARGTWETENAAPA